MSPSSARSMLAASVVAMLALGQAQPSFAQNIPPSGSPATDGDHLLRAFRERILLDTLAIWYDVPGSTGETYSRARAALDVLKVPYTNADSTQGLIWNTGFVTRGGRLGGKVNSASLRCGYGPSGDYADNWRVTVSYAVYVRPGNANAGGSRLGLAMVGQAKDLAGAASPPVSCASKGRLEMEVARMVREAATRQ